MIYNPFVRYYYIEGPNAQNFKMEIYGHFNRFEEFRISIIRINKPCRIDLDGHHIEHLITRKDGNMYFISERKINELIGAHEREALSEFIENIEKGTCQGMLANCSTCDYKWQIRKNYSIPAKCPKCNGNSVEVLAENNAQSISYISLY